jgi:hypothetical protein
LSKKNAVYNKQADMSTTEDSAAEVPNSSPFTQANLVGLFLTLSLCLLTQPWGSLLYRPLGRSRPWIVQFCFFLWRLNPIACVAEAVVIAICLMDTIHSVWRRERYNLSSHAYKLHITAATLLLFRTSEHHGLALKDVLSRPLDIARTTSAGVVIHGPTAGATSTQTTSEVRAASNSEAQQRAEAAEELNSSLSSAVMARK